MKNSTEKLFSTFKTWIPLAVIATLLSGLVYVAMQQNFRLSANDPQIQIVEDVSAVASQGQPADSIVPDNKTDMAKSLAPFLMIFDDSGKLIGSSAKLDGKDVQPPQGAFDLAKQKGQNRFTWQPKNGVRVAVVLMHYSGQQSGFVLAARSLREVEKRERLLGFQVLAGWLASLGASLLAVILMEWWDGRKQQHHPEELHQGEHHHQL